MWIVVAAYLVGAIVAAGVVGGVRDEMDGIGDIAKILFWPVALVLWGTVKVCKAIYGIGRYLRP